MTKQESNSKDRFTLRLPSSLHAEIEAAAKYHGRSVNAEMVARLEAASVGDQFARVLRDLAELKTLDREILEAIADRHTK